MPIRLIPIEGEIVDALKKDFGRYQVTSIPAGAYPGVDTPTPSVGFSALWLVNSRVDPDLVYAITEVAVEPGDGKAAERDRTDRQPDSPRPRARRGVGPASPRRGALLSGSRPAGRRDPAAARSENSEDGTKAAAQDERGNDTPLNSDAAKPKEP